MRIRDEGLPFGPRAWPKQPMMLQGGMTLEQPDSPGQGHRLEPAVHLEAAEDVLDVVTGGAGSDAEELGDLSRPFAVTQVLQHLQLAR